MCTLKALFKMNASSCSRRASEASEETTLYSGRNQPPLLLLSHKIYFVDTRVQKVGKLVRFYFSSTTVQKRRQIREILLYVVVLRSNTSSSTTAYGPLLRL